MTPRDQHNDTPPTAYEVLGLYPHCSAEAIPAAYQRIAREIHHKLSDSEAAQYILAILDYNYGLINTPARRYAYDMVLKHGADSKHITDELSRLKVFETKHQRFKFKLDQARKSNQKRQQKQFTTGTSFIGGFFGGVGAVVIGAIVVAILLATIS